jgi:hypothetical protein
MYLHGGVGTGKSLMMDILFESTASDVIFSITTFVHYLMPAGYCVQSAIYCLLSTVSCLLFVAYCLLSTVCLVMHILLESTASEVKLCCFPLRN